jgi:chromate reductase, NAD(P)H dehydrogenase (quinone)
MPTSVAVLVGSLRKDSFSRGVAMSLTELGPNSLSLEMVEIGHLSLYNQDLDDDGAPPADYAAFRARMRAFDAVLFVTPEHNRSIPAVLKNALDVGSQPSGQSVWDGMPGAIVSVSPSPFGGLAANHHLRQSLAFLNVAAMPQPEAYIGDAASLFNSEREFTDMRNRDLLRKFLVAFAAWSERNAKHARNVPTHL